MIAAFSIVGWRGLRSGFTANPALFTGAGLTLVALTLHHALLSVSVDTSFAASLQLAFIPLAAWLALGGRGAALYEGVFWIGFGIAAVTVIGFVGSGTRAAWPLADPNNLVTLLLMVWTPWLFRRVFAPTAPTQRHQLWIVVAVGVFAFALLASESRFALVALVALLGLLWICFAWTDRRPPIRALALSSAVLMLAIASSFWDPATSSEPGLAVESQPLQDGVSASSNAEAQRLMMNRSALAIIAEESGFWGTGAYTFTLLYPQYRSLGEQTTNGLFVHNDYLQLVQEGGVLYALPLLALVLALLYAGSRTFFGRRFDGAFGFQIALGLACLHALVNFTFYILPLALVFGLLLPRAFARNASEPVTTPVARWAVGLWTVVFAALVYGALLLALDSFSYGVFSGQRGMPGTHYVASDRTRAMDFARFANGLNEHRGIPVLALARYSELSPEVPRDSVADLYREAIRVDPWNPDALRAFYQSGLAPPAQRDALLARAAKLAPQNPDIGLLRVQRYVAQGKLDEAVVAAQSILGWCELLVRKQPAGLDRLGRGLAQLSRQQDGLPIDEPLARCRSIRESTPVTKRTPSRVMRWLQGGQRG